MIPLTKKEFTMYLQHGTKSYQIPVLSFAIICMCIGCRSQNEDVSDAQRSFPRLELVSGLVSNEYILRIHNRDESPWFLRTGNNGRTVYCGVELKAAPEGEWKWDGRTSGLDVGIDCSEIRPGETKEFTLSADSSLKDTRSRLVVFLFRYVRYQESTYEPWRTNVFFGHPEQTEFVIDTIRW